MLMPLQIAPCLEEMAHPRAAFLMRCPPSCRSPEEKRVPTAALLSLPVGFPCCGTTRRPSLCLLASWTPRRVPRTWGDSDHLTGPGGLCSVCQR